MLRYPAPGLLKAFLKSKKTLTKAKAAEQLGIAPSAITQYLNRVIRPRDDIRERIAKWSGGAVPSTAWRTAGELRGIDGVDEAVASDPDESPESEQKTKSPKSAA